MTTTATGVWQPVCPLDRLVCALFGGYAVYQLYAAVWGWRLWRMNSAL